jgi:hypothetical protein
VLEVLVVELVVGVGI